ncbi:class I SAM-dependent methyltransferase [Arthrobacter crystallopoietes]|uniref:Methyltransferase domain-containing protein n=1 Tax=Crystallibacter crystallopoietes TaxID=37928 RepID=A0A1H0ZY94_9MICC|nr:methyltransferase domain-containing protein [Arthrobacter crystallopoietes]AUI51765.1 ubiquinone/menaquinone biosynthesis methyltransferase UbiE [Arthrobacter crystallopoietes]SDQ32350.1 Methyltransferase domain-containing protein [Arthrobacter crystallopoietes]
MAHTESFQLEEAAAEAYEAKFVPAMFTEWAQRMVTVAGVSPGQRILDVACGTGIVARTAAEIAGAEAVTGVDINPAMLAVAARVRPEISWLQGDAAALPVPEGAFDVVLCQMALMFFPDAVAALREMCRAAVDGGTVAVAVPGRLADQPGYGPFVELVSRHADSGAMSLLGVYWACGNLEKLERLFAEAGLHGVESQTHIGEAKYSSAADFVAVEVESTPLMARLTEDQFARIRTEAAAVLQPFAAADGALTVPLQGHIVVGRKAKERKR